MTGGGTTENGRRRQKLPEWLVPDTTQRAVLEDEENRGGWEETGVGEFFVGEVVI